MLKCSHVLLTNAKGPAVKRGPRGDWTGPFTVVEAPHGDARSLLYYDVLVLFAHSRQMPGGARASLHFYRAA
jgi:hypothetical protein